MDTSTKYALGSYLRGESVNGSHFLQKRTKNVTVSYLGIYHEKDNRDKFDGEKVVTMHPEMTTRLQKAAILKPGLAAFDGEKRSLDALE